MAKTTAKHKRAVVVVQWAGSASASPCFSVTQLCIGSLFYIVTSQFLLMISATATSTTAAVPYSSSIGALAFPGGINNNNRRDLLESPGQDVRGGDLKVIHKRDVVLYDEVDHFEFGSMESKSGESRLSLERRYWEKKKEQQNHKSQKSYHEIVKELRKDHILLTHQEGHTNAKKNSLDDGDDNALKEYDNYQKEGRDKQRTTKPKSHFWTILICGAIVIIITLVAIIITLAVFRSRTSSVPVQQPFQSTLEAPKVVVEENLYTVPPKKETQPESGDIGGGGGDIESATESLLPLGNPNPQRQPMAPFTYSPIPIRPDTNSG